ncbi:hypothetical protein Hanom_Chr15g01387251 [Helianthus anomalus]
MNVVADCSSKKKIQCWVSLVAMYRREKRKKGRWLHKFVFGIYWMSGISPMRERNTFLFGV